MTEDENVDSFVLCLDNVQCECVWVVYGGILLLIIPYFTISCHLSVWPEAEAEEDNKINANAPKILRAGKRSNRNLELCWDMRNLFEESSAWFTYQIMIFLDFWNQNYWLIIWSNEENCKVDRNIKVQILKEQAPEAHDFVTVLLSINCVVSSSTIHQSGLCIHFSQSAPEKLSWSNCEENRQTRNVNTENTLNLTERKQSRSS